jgi:hypothetical protein
MQTFRIFLKNEKFKSYLRLSWLIVIIHIIIYLYITLFSEDRYLASGYTFVLIIIGLCLILKYYLQRKKTKWQIGVDVFFILLFLGWITNKQYWPSIIPAVLYILSSLALRKSVIIFSEEKIIFPLRTIRWNELDNTMLKDGLLTMDFKNNKIIQQPIDEAQTNVNEKEFNEFCKAQLTND